MTDTPSLLIIDMVKDYFDDTHPYPITRPARQLIAPINALSRVFREKGFPVVFATDSFQADDFIFKGRMTPHAIAGTTGAEVVADLEMTPEDLWLPKPRFSAFFQTGLETILREKGVTLCAVAGIATNFCVLTTAMDALCHDFKAVLLEDCSTCFTQEAHEQCLGLYRKNPLDPLFQVMTSTALMRDMSPQSSSLGS